MNNHLLQVLKVRNFLFLWLAEVFSQTASSMLNFILILLAYAITNSSTAVAGVVLSFTIPQIIFGIFAGFYVDKWDKRKVLFTTNALRVGLVACITFFHTSLVALYILSFIIAIVAQFFIPAETPIIPLLVEKKLLLSANALFSIALYGSLLLAYALSGPFLLFFGETNVFFALAVFFFFAATNILFIDKSVTQSKVKKTVAQIETSAVKEIKYALKTIIKIKKVFHAFSLLTIAQILIYILAVIGPGYARHILGIPVNQFPLFFVTPAAIGMVLGAVLIINFFNKFSKEKSITIGICLSAICLLLLPTASLRNILHPFFNQINVYLPNILHITVLHCMVVLACILGFANALLFVPSNTILQEETSEAIRGKIYGALNTISGLISLLPIILVGSLSDIFGVGSVLICVGMLLGIFGIMRILIR